MKPCRECQREISEQAASCPHCGAPFPARAKWNGYGFEYKSGLTLMGWPLMHISFKYTAQRRPVVARGIIAIGQFAVGLVSIAQFGVGVVTVSQFAIGVYALAQFGLAWSLIAQMGLYVHQGYGQFVRCLTGLF